MQTKRTARKPRPKVVDGSTWPPLPTPMNDLILSGNVIDLSQASYFFRRKAECCTELKGMFEALPNFRYRLKEPFRSFFAVNLPLCVRDTPLQPADALAQALFELGQYGAKIDFGMQPLPIQLTDEFLRKAWNDAEKWQAFLNESPCIGQGWWLTLADDGTVKPWSGQPDPRDFELWICFSSDMSKPPSMTISVTGKPAQIFMKFWTMFYPISPNRKHSNRTNLEDEAEKVLGEILKTLRTKLQLLRSESGRPTSELGEHAAFRLHHKKQSLALITKELCHLPSSASTIERRQCFDRIRKAVKNYYKRLRTEFYVENGDFLRQRIHHVPVATPTPFKSE